MNNCDVKKEMTGFRVVIADPKCITATTEAKKSSANGEVTEGGEFWGGWQVLPFDRSKPHFICHAVDNSIKTTNRAHRQGQETLPATWRIPCSAMTNIQSILARKPKPSFYLPSTHRLFLNCQQNALLLGARCNMPREKLATPMKYLSVLTFHR